MIHHYIEGYQDVIKNDPYHIEERLQEYCSDLSIMYNPKENKWRVFEGDWCVFTVPYRQLDDRTYWDIRRVDKHNGFNVTQELRKSEDRAEKAQQKHLDDLVYEMSKDLRKAAWKE